MKDRDTLAIEVLRTVLGAIDNAEAVAPPATATSGSSEGRIAGARRGVGAGDVARRDLSEGDVRAIVRAEVRDLRSSAEQYRGLEQHAEAARLRAQADLLEAHLST